jgi:hypothetical protein
MDNKITKRRLHDFFSYEWVIMIVVIIVGILAWDLIFTMTRVKLTPGQDFLIFYDETVDAQSASQTYALYQKDGKENRTVFSFDVLRLGHEELTSEYNVMQDRLTIQEGDVVVTDCTEPDADATNKSVRAKTLIDKYPICDYQTLLEDAENYLAKLLKNEYLDSEGKKISGVDVTDFNNIDLAKVEALFRQRMARDNRYRTELQIKEGIKLEEGRIDDLCYEVKRFRYLLTRGNQYFLTYTRFDQTIAQDEGGTAEETYKNDKYRLLGERKYGLKVEALSGGSNKETPAKHFRKKGASDAKDVVILVFDLKAYQPHLQYEAIAYINAIVDGCSSLYDNL